MNHKQWLDNEYKLWVDALQSCSVNNFKDHPIVKRMLGEIDPQLFHQAMHLQHILLPIDNIGRTVPGPVSGVCLRMAWYAMKVIELAPASIVEIGGGVGQFYAVLRALGYKGSYYIYDLEDVQKFQQIYLNECSKRINISLSLRKTDKPEMVVSFYAFGEFDDYLKQSYMPLIKDSKHGLIAWNPHSGATDNAEELFPHATITQSEKEP